MQKRSPYKISGLEEFCKKIKINKYGIKDFLGGKDSLGERGHKVNQHRCENTPLCQG